MIICLSLKNISMIWSLLLNTLNQVTKSQNIWTEPLCISNVTEQYVLTFYHNLAASPHTIHLQCLCGHRLITAIFTTHTLALLVSIRILKVSHQCDPVKSIQARSKDGWEHYGWTRELGWGYMPASVRVSHCKTCHKTCKSQVLQLEKNICRMWW